MKSIVALFVCALTATALADAEINETAFKAGRDRIMAMSRTCDENPATAVDQKALKKYLQSNGPAPANGAAHALCITKNLGWQNEDGSVNKPVITEKVKAIFGSVDAKVQQYIEECTEAKATPEDTAEQLLKCYRKHSPKIE
uniref:Odorant binding protein 6 n=1 Tax=Dendroctonus ponderosae TaxID=77166 RepID=A0A0H3W5A2_DENPD|nr:odorant binding protein 6 [Dendroctonus ponderosae]